MLLSHISKAYFEALLAAIKRFSIKDYILSITTNNYVVNNVIVERFEKQAS